jgi:hypothetical protein
MNTIKDTRGVSARKPFERVPLSYDYSNSPGFGAMTRFIRFTLFALVVVASIWSARPAKAQDTSKSKTPPSSVKSEPVITSSDSVTIADVQKAADDLAIAVQAAVRKATEDPAIKVAALKVAKNAVTAAQIVVTQQAETLQSILDSLAKEIAMATEKQQAKVKSH